jgi:hypothetical protein
MDPNEIRDLEEMFATNGWRRIAADAEAAIAERGSRALGARSWDEVVFSQGEVAQLQVLVALEATVALQKRALEEQDDE